MTKRKVFYSFHYEKDVMRVSLIRNIGAIEGNTPLNNNDWEKVKRNGDKSIKKWIDDNMNSCSCVIVLVGENTNSRNWVKYEINKAITEGKAILGIYIHNIKCPNNGIGTCGENPLPKDIKIYNPPKIDAYNYIRDNIERWVEEALK